MPQIPYFEFAQELVDNYAILDRGEVTLDGSREDVQPEDARRWLTV